MQLPTTALPDWETRVRTGQSLIPKPMFPEEAEECLAIFNSLRIVDAPGSPEISECCAPWVSDFAGAVFGSYEKNSGIRHLSEFALLIPKKNSKSTIAAGIMLTILIRNWRKSAEFIILSPTIEVAGNSFKPAQDMIEADEELSELLHVQPHIKTITHRVTGATLKVIAADGGTVGGKKAAGVLIDEAWLFGKNPKAEDIIREATGGLASRPEGFVIWLTTQSNEPPAGVFKNKLNYWRAVRDGRIDDRSTLPVLYEFPPSMIKSGEARQSENWWMVNPNMNYSVSEAYLLREFAKDQESGEESVRGFLAKFLNIEIGLALMSNRWAGADFWETQAVGVKTLDELLERAEVVTVGIDGGGLDDLLGFAVIGRCKETRLWLVWFRAWAHASVLERHKQDASKLRDFEKAGELVIVERAGDDVEEVADLCAQIEASEKLDKIGTDPAGIGSILEALDAAGIDTEEKVVGVSQGWRLGGAIKTAERKLAEGVLCHGGMALMNWCVGNARVEPKGNAILITKQASGSGKIDPLMAMFNAVQLMALNPASPAKAYQMFFL